jgi:2-iminobutanoate/2-iminopropanoate deaminase
MPDKARGTRRHLKSERTQARAYSRAVVTEGYGRTIWLAGQTAVEDLDGQSLAGNFDGQVRSVFAQLARTLEEVGAKLSDMVTMTVFITDARYGLRFLEIRKEIFGDNFAASALITAAGARGRNSWLKCRGSPWRMADPGKVGVFLGMFPSPLVA